MARRFDAASEKDVRNYGYRPYRFVESRLWKQGLLCVEGETRDAGGN